jgi:hypothetical protein
MEPGSRPKHAKGPHLPQQVRAFLCSASVISSILATVLALSTGYRGILVLAALCYLGAAWAGWPFGAQRCASARL